MVLIYSPDGTNVQSSRGGESEAIGELTCCLVVCVRKTFPLVACEVSFLSVMVAAYGIILTACGWP